MPSKFEVLLAIIKYMFSAGVMLSIIFFQPFNHRKEKTVYSTASTYYIYLQ